MTAAQKRNADWGFKNCFRNCGSNIIWTTQVDANTGMERYVRQTNTDWGDAASGKTVYRYGSTPRN